MENKKIVLIIGGSSGIGLAAGKKFAENGYTVYNGSRSYANSEDILSLTVDITNRKTVSQAVDFILDREGRLDILVNSAGYSMAAPVEYADEADYRYLFDVNFFGPVSAIQSVLPAMKRQGGGRIINISSVGGLFPIAYDAFYSASKAALDMLAKELSLELASFDVHVTNILPGGTRTPFTASRNVYSDAEGGEYADNLKRASESLAEIEQHGMTPESVADTILKVAHSTHPPLLVAAGFSNKLTRFASRLMPDKPALALLKRRFHLEQPAVRH